MSLNYSSIQKPLLCSDSPSTNFLYGPYADWEELNNTFQDLGMDEEGAIPEYLTVLVEGTEYWYVGNAWVKKNDSKPSEDYTMNLTGRFTVSLDNDNLILDDDTSSADLALHTNQVTLYDYGANVTSNCTNWTATIPAGSNLQADINNGVVTLSKKTEGKLVEGDYAVVITWNYTIQNEQGNSLDITMTKKQQVTIKNLNQGESYKLLVTPTVLKLNHNNDTSENIVTKLIRIKDGISTEIGDYTLKYKFASDSDLAEMYHESAWTDLWDDKVENLTIFAYINGDTLVDQQTITVMRDDNKLTLSNPIVILDDNTTNLTDIKNASITSILFNGEEVTSGIEVDIPSPASSHFMQGREGGRRFLQLITAGEQNNNNQEDVHRLPLVDTEFDVTYTYNGYSAVQRVKIANISQGQVYSLKASPQFVAVNNQGSIEQVVNLIFSSIYRGQITSHELDSLVVEYKFDGDPNWTNILSSQQLTLNGNTLTFNSEGNDYSPRNNLYIRVTDAEGSIVYDETEIAFVKAGADGKNSDALGWRVSLDNDFFVLDDDVDSNVYTSVSTTHPKIYYNSHDVTSQFKLVDNLSVVKTTSTELRVVHDNDIDYHIEVTNNNVTKLDTSSLGTTGKVLLYFVPKNVIEGEDVDITSGSEVLTSVASDFTLGATASYLINDISDGFSYKLEIDPPYQNVEYTTEPTILISPPKKITLYKVSPKGTEIVPTSQYILKYSTNDTYLPINPGDPNYSNSPTFNYIHNCLTKLADYYDDKGAVSKYSVSTLKPIKFAAFTLDGQTILDVEYITLNMRGQQGPAGASASVSDVINGLNITALRFKGEWKSGSTYKAAESSGGNNLKMQDYVTVSTSPSAINLDSGAQNVTYTVVYFKCIQDITNSTAQPNLDTSHWERIGSTDLVCGIVKAQTVQATSVLIQDTNQHLVAGVQGKETGTSNPIMFAGCDIDTNDDSNTTINIQNSPFRVYENGDVVANSLKFAGWQYMLSKEVTTTDFIDKQTQFPLGLFTYTTYIDSNNQAYMFKDLGFTGNIVNPEKLGQFILVNTNRSIYLPSFAVDYSDYYDDPNSLVSPSYVVPGIVQGSGDTSFPDELFNYMAACRQLVGNKLTCIILNDAEGSANGDSWTNTDERINLGNAGRAIGGSIFGLLSYCDVQGIIIDTQIETPIASNTQKNLKMVLECVQTNANDARETEAEGTNYNIASDTYGVYLELNNSGDKLYFADLAVYNQSDSATNPWDSILNYNISFKDYSNKGIVLQLECCHDFTWNSDAKSEIVYWKVNKIAVLDDALPCIAWYYNRNEEGVFSSMQNLVSSN